MPDCGVICGKGSELSRTEQVQRGLRGRRWRTIGQQPDTHCRDRRNDGANRGRPQWWVGHETRLSDSLVRSGRHLAATRVVLRRFKRTFSLTTVRAVRHPYRCKSAGRAELHPEQKDEQDCQRSPHDFDGTPGVIIAQRFFSVSAQKGWRAREANTLWETLLNQGQHSRNRGSDQHYARCPNASTGTSAVLRRSAQGRRLPGILRRVAGGMSLTFSVERTRPQHQETAWI
jgi:hypothetical protein